MLTEAVLAATEGNPRTWMYRLLHLVAFETRDKVVWESLDALADDPGRPDGGGAQDRRDGHPERGGPGARPRPDRNDVRIDWALKAM